MQRSTLALFGLYRAYPLAVAGVLATMLTQLAFALAFPIGARLISDTAIASGDIPLLTLALAVLGGGFVLSSAAAVAQDRLVTSAGSRVVQGIRGGLFRHVLEHPGEVLAGHSQADVLSRFSNDVAAVEGGVVRGVPVATYHVLLAASSVALLFIVDWRLALACTLISPIVLLGPRLLGRRAAAASEQKKRNEAAVLGHMHTLLHSWPVVHAFLLRPLLLGRYSEQSGVLRQASAGSSYIAALLGRVSTFGVMLLVLVVVGLGSVLAVRAQLTVGTLLAAMVLLFNLEAAAVGLTEAIPLLLQAAAGWRRIDAVRSLHLAHDQRAEEAELHDRADRAGSGAPRVSVRNLVLVGSGDRRILDDVSLDVESGQTVALVGASGSGKSSLFEVLVGLRAATHGTVSFDGRSLAQIGIDNLLREVGVAFQTPYMLPGTVAENILLGKPDASDAEIEAAARLAHVHEQISSLPAAYLTEVAGDGVGLAGGERQRVALARALIRRPTLLLLDEPTSALDPATEAAVAASIGDLPAEVTVIWATHQIARAATADHVFVLERGRLVEQGRHDDLVSLAGVYAGLWHAQQGFRVSADGSEASVDAQRLSEIPLLAELPRRYLRQISTRFTTHVFEPAEFIVREGHPASHFYLVARGQVEILRGGDAEVVVATLEPGAFFGEVSLLTGDLANASVRSVGRTVSLVLSRDGFRTLMAESPRLEAAIRPVMEARRQRGAAIESDPSRERRHERR